MNTPSKLLPLFFALLLFLIPLTSILNTDLSVFTAIKIICRQTYKPFHGLTATTSNQRDKNIDHSFSIIVNMNIKLNKFITSKLNPFHHQNLFLFFPLFPAPYFLRPLNNYTRHNSESNH